MGKEKRFAERFVGMLSAFNAIECKEGGDSVSTQKMARLVEILFFISKNSMFFSTCHLGCQWRNYGRVT
jgi:hypothetical protein